MTDRAPLHLLRTLLYFARAILAVYGRKGLSQFAAASPPPFRKRSGFAS